MVLKIVFAIILAFILGAIISFMFSMSFNLFCDKDVECFGKEIEVSTASKFKLIGIDIFSLYMAYSIVRYLHIYDFFYKLLWSRMDNCFVDAIISTFTVVPLMLLMSRWIINKVMDYSEVAAYEGKIVLALAWGTPITLTILSLAGEAMYVIIFYLIPLYLTLCVVGAVVAAPLMALPFVFSFFDFAGLFGIAGLFILIFANAADQVVAEYPTFKSQIVSGYAAADRKAVFTVGKYDEKKYDWKAFAQAQDKSVTYYYDDSSVSLDDKNGIATVLIKVQKGKEIDLSRAIVSYHKDVNEMLITDTWSNTVPLSLSNEIYKIEPKSTYSFLVEKLNDNLELRKEKRDTLTIDEFIAQYHAKMRTPFPKQQNINAIGNSYNVYLVGGKTKLLNANGRHSRTLYVLTDEKAPVKVSLLDEKVVIAERNVAYPKMDFKAALTTSTRDNIQTVMLKKGQRYTIVNGHAGRYTLAVKDSNGKTVTVGASQNNLFIPKDERIVKCRFTYRGISYTEWISDADLTVDKK